MNKELAYNFLNNLEEFKKQFERVLDRTPNERAPGKIEFWVEFFRSIALSIQNSELGKSLEVNDICFSVGNSGDAQIIKLAFKVNGNTILRSISVSDKSTILTNSQYSKNEIKAIENYFFGEDARNTLVTTINLKNIDSKVLHLNIKNDKIQLKNNNDKSVQGSSGGNAINLKRVEPLQELVNGKKTMLDSILDRISNPATANKENVGEFFSKLIELYKQNLVPGRSKSLEAESHGFTYGLFTLLYKQKYGLDIYVEQSAGRGYLDLYLLFRKNYLGQNIEDAPKIVMEFKDSNIGSVQDAVKQIQNKAYGQLLGRTSSNKVISVGINFSIKELKVQDFSINLPKQDFISILMEERQATLTQDLIEKNVKAIFYAIRSDESLDKIILGQFLSSGLDKIINIFTFHNEPIKDSEVKRSTIFVFKNMNITPIILNIIEAENNEHYDRILKNDPTKPAIRNNIESKQVTIIEELDKAVLYVQQKLNINSGKRIDITINSKAQEFSSKHIDSYCKEITINDLVNRPQEKSYISQFIKEYDIRSNIDVNHFIDKLRSFNVDHQKTPPHDESLDTKRQEEFNKFREAIFKLRDFIIKEQDFKSILHGMFLHKEFNNEKLQVIPEMTFGFGRADLTLIFENDAALVLELGLKSSGAMVQDKQAQLREYIKHSKTINDGHIGQGVVLILDRNVQISDQVLTGKSILDEAVYHHTTEEESSPEKQSSSRGIKRSDRSDSEDNKSPKKVKLLGCLPASNSRSKRESSNCKISWEDIDKFNDAEKIDQRNPSKIIINSDRFIHELKTQTDHDKRDQLMQLPDELKVIHQNYLSGDSISRVHQIINNKKVITHSKIVHRVSNHINQGMIVKDVVSNIINGNYEELAITVGFISGTAGLHTLSESMMVKSLQLSSEGTILSSRLLKFAAPIVRKGGSVLSLYNLIHDVKSLKAGESDAVLNTIEDATFVIIDTAELGLELASAETALAVAGPVGEVIGVVVFVGVEIYKAVEQVDNIDHLIHLTGWEKFKEGCRAFLHLPQEEYIQKLIQEEQQNDRLVTDAINFLKLKMHQHIQHYVFAIKPNSDDIVDLQNIRDNLEFTRTSPQNPSEGKLLCIPEGSDIQRDNIHYRCKNAIGISYNKNRTNNATLLDLGDGNDTVYGFHTSDNIFIVRNGYKNLTGGSQNDMFILMSQNVTGILDGGTGIDTVDMQHFNISGRIKIAIDHRSIGTLTYKNNQNYTNTSAVRNFENMIGRKNLPDDVIIENNSNKTLYTIDTQGGNIDNYDDIEIYYSKIKCIVSPYTQIHDKSLEDNTYYIKQGNGRVDIIFGTTNSNQANNLIFDYNLFDICNINISKHLYYQYNIYNLRFSQNNNILSVNIMEQQCHENCFTIKLNDASTLYLINNQSHYAVKKFNISMSDIKSNLTAYSNKAEQLQLHLLLYSNDNQVLHIAHSKHKKLKKNLYKVNILKNEPNQITHLVGAQNGDNIFQIDHANLNLLQKCINNTVILHLPNHSFTTGIDLILLSSRIQKMLNKQLKFKVYQDKADILITTFYDNDNIIESREGSNVKLVPISRIILKNTTALIYDHLFISNIIDGIKSTFNIKTSNNTKIYSARFCEEDKDLQDAKTLQELDVIPKPQPLFIEKTHPIVIIDNYNIKLNQEIISEYKSQSPMFYLTDSGDVVITNSKCDIKYDDLYSIMLINPCANKQKFNTLSVEFHDWKIVKENFAKNLAMICNSNRHYNINYTDHINECTQQLLSFNQNNPVIPQRSVRHTDYKHFAREYNNQQFNQETNISNIINSLDVQGNLHLLMLFTNKNKSLNVTTYKSPEQERNQYINELDTKVHNAILNATQKYDIDNVIAARGNNVNHHSNSAEKSKSYIDHLITGATLLGSLLIGIFGYKKYKQHHYKSNDVLEGQENSNTQTVEQKHYLLPSIDTPTEKNNITEPLLINNNTQNNYTSSNDYLIDDNQEYTNYSNNNELMSQSSKGSNLIGHITEII